MSIFIDRLFVEQKEEALGPFFGWCRFGFVGFWFIRIIGWACRSGTVRFGGAVCTGCFFFVRETLFDGGFGFGFRFCFSSRFDGIFFRFRRRFCFQFRLLFVIGKLRFYCLFSLSYLFACLNH